MVSRETMVKAIVDRVNVTKKIKAERDDIEKLVNSILDSIDTLNNMHEFAAMCWGKPLNEIIVADEWKDLILPASVRLDPTDLKTADLLSKSVVNPSDDISQYVNWVNDQLKFRSLFKKDLSNDVTTLDKLRQPKALFDVLPVATFGSSKDDDNAKAKPSVRSVDEPFIPIRLKPEVRVLFREDYCNTNCYQMVTDYFAKFLM